MPALVDVVAVTLQVAKFTILTAGSRGDVQPYLALGVGLSARGHAVKVAAFPGYESMAERLGLEFAPVRNPSEILNQREDLVRLKERAHNSITNLRYMISALLASGGDGFRASHRDYLAACRGTDCVISGWSTFGGPLIARTLEARHVWALLHPLSRTGTRPHFLLPFSLGKWGNLMSHVVADWIYRVGFEPATRELRAALRGSGRRAKDVALSRAGGLVLLGYSPSLVPTPADAPRSHRVTGFWFLDQWVDDEPDAAIRDFLAEPPAPAYVTLPLENDQTEARLLDACSTLGRTLGQRFLVRVRDRRVERISPHVLTCGTMSHSWLLPRVAMVVHHGGAGTTAAVLRAGKVSVVLPGSFDQPYWGRRLLESDLAPAPLQHSALNADTLGSALQRAVEPARLASALRIGDLIERERGVHAACLELERAVGTDRGDERAVA